LRDQWAGLFAEYLRNRQNQKLLSNIAAQIEELSQVSGTLRKYTEALMEKVQPHDYEKIIEDESKKIEDANKRKIFFEHYLPDMIMDRVIEAGIKIRKDDIYTAYIQTDNFDDFLKRLGFNEQQIDIIHKFCMHYDGYFELSLLLKPELYPHLINSNGNY
jgi:O-methyltransferase involved in polyketide biosynthesis